MAMTLGFAAEWSVAFFVIYQEARKSIAQWNAWVSI